MDSEKECFAYMHDEFDFSSLGRKISFRRKIDIPYGIDFGAYEKDQFCDNKVRHAHDELAAEILKTDIIEVRRGNDFVEITGDCIILTPKDYYEMLSVITKLAGSTRVRTVK